LWQVKRLIIVGRGNASTPDVGEGATVQNYPFQGGLKPPITGRSRVVGIAEVILSLTTTSVIFKGVSEIGIANAPWKVSLRPQDLAQRSSM
jgi:hypothetical protein